MSKQKLPVLRTLKRIERELDQLVDEMVGDQGVSAECHATVCEASVLLYRAQLEFLRERGK